MQALSIEICLSPALFPFTDKKRNQIVVVVDVFRATTSMIAAFDYGAESIIPVASKKEALEGKKKGCLIAGEKDGIKHAYADLGNSPFDFDNRAIAGKNIVYLTTNGTKAIQLAAKENRLYLGAFSNLEALSKHLIKQQTHVLILCAGWKNQFSLEDTICAGAFVEEISQSKLFIITSDAAVVASNLWKANKKDLAQVLSTCNHARRLKALGYEKDIVQCTRLNISNAIPFYEDGKINNLINTEMS
ncbi:MAG: 2-phosphosulfolactate phosphatase [Bacteroidales bacterium]|nr:2-phosphosulfolactate phosphatase [Bacteroidales bacterium]